MKRPPRERPKTIEEAAGRLWAYARPAAPGQASPATARLPIDGASGRPSENPQIGDVARDPSQTRLALAISRRDAQRFIDAWDLYSLVLSPLDWHDAFGPVMPDAVRYLRGRLSGRAWPPDALREGPDVPPEMKESELAIEGTPEALEVLMIFACWDAPLLAKAHGRILTCVSRWQESRVRAKRPDDPAEDSA